VTTNKRSRRHSDAGRDKQARNSRAGQDRHPSGNYVRKIAPPTDAHEDELAPQRTAEPVSVPRIKSLERKQIAGEWIE
jgi:hypothetical protein